MKARWLQFLLPLAVVGIAVGLRIGTGTSDRLFLLASDLYQQWQPRPFDPELPVRVVTIDEASVAEFGQWPWPRLLVARLVQRLEGAAAIGFDMVLAEPDRMSPTVLIATLRSAGEDVDRLAGSLDRLPDYDRRLAAAMARSDAVVMGEVLAHGAPSPLPAKAGFVFSGYDPLPAVATFSGAVGNLPELDKAAKGVGFLNHIPEWDRILRRVPLIAAVEDPATGKRAARFSLAAETLRVAQGARSHLAKGVGASGEWGRDAGMVALRIGAIEVPTDAAGRVWLHYTEPADRARRHVSARDVLHGRLAREEAEGRIFLVGTTIAGAGGSDYVATPVTQHMAGVDIHAQLIEQVLAGWHLARPDWLPPIEITAMALIGIALGLLIPQLGAARGALLTLVVLVAGIGLSAYAFDAWRVLVDPVYPATVTVAVYALSSLVGYLRSEAQQRQIRGAFARYMSPVLVDELARHPEKLKLGGEEREMTLLFCDIRDFTTMSEKMSPEELTAFINRFFTPLTEIILAHKGTIDKYIGDCVMAFWNAPLDDPHHAANALRAALAIRRRMALLNEGAAAPIRIGIGINTGPCCVGNMGSDHRFDYSVIGDAVNVAARLEGQCKVFGVELVVGEATVALAPEFDFVELGRLTLRGKAQGVRAFTTTAGAPAPPAA
jgi:adenylate cyclase